MGAYILRRLFLIIPTLIGIMLINFALIQFVPGGPIEQIIAQMEDGSAGLQIDLQEGAVMIQLVNLKVANIKVPEDYPPN